MTKLTNIVEESKKYNSLEDVEKELRSIQTKKCRFKKQKERKDYEKVMTEILRKEQVLKEVKNLFQRKRTTVTNFCQKDVDLLDYDETIKAIKSIQSKKCNTQYLTDKTEYNSAVEIEKMLLEHKKNVKPVPETAVEKSKVYDLIKSIENLKDVDKDTMIRKLQELL